jgi:hypothetical protein
MGQGGACLDHDGPGCRGILAGSPGTDVIRPGKVHGRVDGTIWVLGFADRTPYQLDAGNPAHQ